MSQLSSGSEGCYPKMCADEVNDEDEALPRELLPKEPRSTVVRNPSSSLLLSSLELSDTQVYEP